ncbi:SCO0930 family lipoprotein [Streptomyces sp. NPDC050504]|uniref:SCO0930 family lipoprotein n=1 Tax=Streptomyces sp. NPDC050504 TaxID=3365618 RepID=UPI00379D32A9
MRIKRGAPLAATAATAAALLALTTACGQEDGSGKDGGAAKAAGAGNARPAAGGYGSDDGYGSGSGAAPLKAAGALAVREDPKLGRFLTDSAGFTLYRFDKDTAEPSASNCTGDCLKAWPAAAAEGAVAPAGTNASAFGSLNRPEGAQLTVGGWPVYRFAKDAAPGDTKGQGVGGTWFAVAPDGKKAAPGGAGGAGEADRPGLSVRKDPRLGEIVVNSEGMTVYRFKKDSAWPMKSACTGECLKKWPVVEPVAKNDTKGITRKGYVVFDRPDGIKQQTVDCWPLYTFSGDAAPGDTKGQGVGGTWFAVAPDGKLVGAPK